MFFVGFLLSFISPLSLVFVYLYIETNPDNGFIALVLWSVIGFGSRRRLTIFVRLGSFFVQ